MTKPTPSTPPLKTSLMGWGRGVLRAETPPPELSFFTFYIKTMVFGGGFGNCFFIWEIGALFLDTDLYDF